MDINNIKIKVEDLSDNYGKFIIEPLEKGYGVTLVNNALLIELPKVTP